MDISAIRLANMHLLIDRAGGRTSFSDKMGVSYAQISHYVGKNPSRNIGDKIARQAEDVFGLEHGWMDCLHGLKNEPPTVSTSGHVMGSIKVPVLNKTQIIELFNCKTGFKSLNDISSINIIEWLYTDMDVTEKAFVFDIEDESMSPDYVIGHKILVEPEIEPVPADDVCAYIEGEGLVFRRYKKLNARGDFELQSLNPLFASYLSTDTEIVIVGVMLVHWRYRKPR
jgi:SOS-response transcriptional repressor LexA